MRIAEWETEGGTKGISRGAAEDAERSNTLSFTGIVHQKARNGDKKSRKAAHRAAAKCHENPSVAA
jgi:hypothetical protein